MTESRQRETWRKWLPPDAAEPRAFLSRDQFLLRLSRHGFDVKEGDLRFWERRGILPRGELRWDPETKAPRSYYPYFMFAPVVMLRELQRDGVPLKEMAPRLQKVAEKAARSLSNFPEDDEFIAIMGVFYEFESSLDDAVTAYAKRYERLTGRSVGQVQFVMFDQDGEGILGHSVSVGRDRDSPHPEGAE